MTHDAAALPELSAKEFFSPHLAQFRTAVLAHMASMDPLELQLFRERASEKRYSIAPSLTCQVYESHGALVDAVLTYDNGPTMRELTNQFRPNTVVGTIAGQSIVYFDSIGVYAFGATTHDTLTMSVWLTFPAYPKGW
jgi:hypothetical protein